MSELRGPTPIPPGPGPYTRPPRYIYQAGRPGRRLVFPGEDAATVAAARPRRR